MLKGSELIDMNRDLDSGARANVRPPIGSLQDEAPDTAGVQRCCRYALTRAPGNWSAGYTSMISASFVAETSSIALI